jgi:ATP-binding protein involved in chromosome partitioning
MINNVKELIKNITNPATNKSLLQEDRIVSVEMNETEQVVITYKRDGISPLEKREIEKAFTAALSSALDQSRFLIKTVSQRSEDVYKAVNSSTPEAPKVDEQAALKVGHETIKQKKRVPNVKNVICVASGKGGVGKSTFAVNLAISLKNAGKSVGLIDADIYGPSIPLMLGEKNAKPKSNENKKIMPLHAHGVKFMSFGLFINEDDPVIWRGPMLGGVLNQFLFDVEWGETDYLIIDLPPGTGDVQLSMVQSTEVDGAIIISTPQDVALLDTIKGLNMFKQLDLPIIGLVENMSYFLCDGCDKKHYIFGNQGVLKASRKLDIPQLGEIPLETKIRLESDRGVPFMSNDERSSGVTWKSYTSIASKVDDHFSKVDMPTPEPKKKGILSKIFGN